MDTLEEAYQERLKCLITLFSAQFPSISGEVDGLRESVISIGEYGDDQVIKWVKLGEQIPVIIMSKRNKFLQKDVGLIDRLESWLICTDWFDPQINDLIRKDGEFLRVTERKEQMGIRMVRLESPDARLQVNLPREAPIYRQIGIKCRIA